MKNPQGEAQRWMEQASADLDAARSLFGSGHWWAVCFHAQQAAEKAVKAFLYAKGERMVLGHSVAELAEQAARYDSTFGEVVDAARRLDRLYIPTRYPNALPGGVPARSYAQDDAEGALDMAQAVVSFVRSLLPDA